jgi:hypothetical protein
MVVARLGPSAGAQYRWRLLPQSALPFRTDNPLSGCALPRVHDLRQLAEREDRPHRCTSNPVSGRGSAHGATRRTEVRIWLALTASS